MDFLSASIILVFILLVFILVWNGLVIRWNNGQEYRQMYTNAMFAAEVLLTTPGKPESWENLEAINGSTIHSLGLVNGRNEINNKKIETFVELNATNYEMVKKKLGIIKYELEIKVMDLSESEEYYVFGKSSTGLNSSVVLERIGLLNNTPVIVRIEVWK